MQGNLNEIDIRSILLLIELGQRTGVLFVEKGAVSSNHRGAIQASVTAKTRSSSEHDSTESWFVFFLDGQIVYANDGGRSQSRLDDYLRHYRVKLAPDAPDKFFKSGRFDVEVHFEKTQQAFCTSHPLPEYSHIWALLEQNIINTAQARSIIQGFIHETIFDLLNLQQGNFIFEQTSPLAPVLTTWKTAALTSQIIRQLQDWKQLYPYIQSPNQLPMLTSVVRLRSRVSVVTVKKLKQWADGKTSLRQLARYLNRDVLTVAKALYPYIQKGWVQLVYTNTIGLIESEVITEENQIAAKKTIVFIDPEASICSSVESVLMSEGFNACIFTNPIQALNGIFTLNPNLIICKLAMPSLNGYEICAMLRSCQAFRYLPIIMLTDRDDFAQGAKARMAGATECLSKPFSNAELVILVKKYLNNRTFGNKKNTALVDYIQYRVKDNIT